MSAQSCDQLCPFTADHISATCQCHVPVPISATYQCLPVHINATYQCPSELPFSVTHQCQSVPPNSACPSVHLISAHHYSLICTHQ
ncbi:unnamed protein product [Staurois parvus]|uniref:Uncharacterized protein n=1 Tax=Staurois parvus TaxID=386267 RepID=A0ABN9BYI1_9NEOB|nr:unnamed protein product [Staurois parvus]